MTNVATGETDVAALKIVAGGAETGLAGRVRVEDVAPRIDACGILFHTRVVGSAEIHQFFRIIDRQANRMDALIGDLLDAGRIEAGTLSVAPEPTEVAMLVDQARNTFLTGGGRHPVLIDISEDLPQVLADRERIVQVLNNLLANAARAAPDSSPIRIGAEAEGVYVAVWVADEGRGMEPARLARLFARRSASPEGVGRAPGCGLGLAICKGLVEAHGGRIRAESGGVGSGLRVTFTVPAAGGGAVTAPGAGWRGDSRRGAVNEKYAGLPSWRSTTTRRRCATCATRSRRRSLRRS